MFPSSLNCPLKCVKDSDSKLDTQQHILECSKLSDQKISIDGIFSDNLETQVQVAKNINRLYRKRQQLLEDQEASKTGLPGASILDTSSQGTTVQLPAQYS